MEYEVNIIEVFMNEAKVGRMALTPDFLCAFEYDPVIFGRFYFVDIYFVIAVFLLINGF